jgi:hypothetical protein
MSDKQSDPISDSIENVLRTLQWGYYVWFFIYVILLLLSVGLPGIAAMGIFAGVVEVKTLAGAGALSAAVNHALRPQEYATAYDAGVQLAWKTRVSWIAKTLDPEGVARDLKKAIDRTTFKYGQPRSIDQPMSDA